MRRLPRGGKKVNYTLYIPLALRQNIKDRAEALDYSEGFYLSMLVEQDKEAGISER